MVRTQRKEQRLHQTSHPVLYEVNVRVLLHELSEATGKKITLATIPEKICDEWADRGFDLIWLMGVWTTGAVGVEIARNYPTLQPEYRKALLDYTEEDVLGSPYAVKAYTVSRELGGNKGLLTFRKRLRERGLGLILDFVCNHTARDHVWVTKHPEYYVHGGENEDVEKPEFFFRIKTSQGQNVIAFGRDPYFPGWTDTAQLNYRHPALRKAMIDTLKKVAALCDGVRCDMAMLVLQEVFQRTWGDKAIPEGPEGVQPAAGEFWSEAIAEMRKRDPRFLFIAETYWNLEWQIQQLGFDFTYDKTLYDKLLKEGASSVYNHLKAEKGFQEHSVRFIENHDEPRAAHVLSSESWHCAAAAVISTVPGMVMYHDGQFEGRKTKVPVQLRRRQSEVPSLFIKSFYTKLLQCINSPVFRQGDWQLLNSKPAWNDNHTWRNFLAWWWYERSHGARLIVINYAPHNGQCYVELHLEQIAGSAVEFRDLLGEAAYVRERSALIAKGMYFDLPAYGLHIFDVTEAHKSSHSS